MIRDGPDRVAAMSADVDCVFGQCGAAIRIESMIGESKVSS